MSALTIQYGHADELTRSAATELTGRLRAALRNAAHWAATAQELIQEAWAMRADITLGYETWEAYCEDVFAGVRDMRLPAQTRRAIVDELREQGMSLRAIAAPLGIAEGTVRGDLRAIGSSHDTPVAGIDGRAYRVKPNARNLELSEAKCKETGRNLKSPGQTKTERAENALLKAGAEGLTALELERKMKWRYTSILTRLHQQRRIECLDAKRDGHSIWVHRDHVDGRHTKPPGRIRQATA